MEQSTSGIQSKQKKNYFIFYFNNFIYIQTHIYIAIETNRQTDMLTSIIRMKRKKKKIVKAKI